ncbi:hypothetical protein C8J57DRAFT_1726032 [Mycena rebaudengoi]|nr:hypothetical protein C8J57DRAFT_1726032 [Mycena rebaudengoi]
MRSHGTHSSNTSATSEKKWWPLPSIPSLPGANTGWTSDAGWGCMLRTGQSLLAAAVGLARVVKREVDPSPAFTPLTPRASSRGSSTTPRRHSLAGKALGKDVSMWLGPSAAAGAMRTFAVAFPACGLGVSAATDSTLYQTEVAHPSSSSHHSHASYRELDVRVGGAKSPVTKKRWGDRPAGHSTRAGWRESEMLYTFPQSVDIAGRRPSSSYYFAGVQGDGLFCLDPQHSRPAVPLCPAPVPSAAFSSSTSESPVSPPMTEDELLLNAQRAEDKLVNDPSGMIRAEEAFYLRAYSPAEPRTFHCENMHKMPRSGLDPSMLIGFASRDEAEWVDLRRRIASHAVLRRGVTKRVAWRLIQRVVRATTRFDLSGGPNERNVGEKGRAGSPFPEEDVDAGRENNNGDDPLPSAPVPAPAPAKKSKSGGGKGRRGAGAQRALSVPGSAQDGPTGGKRPQQERADEREREPAERDGISAPASAGTQRQER